MLHSWWTLFVHTNNPSSIRKVKAIIIYVEHGYITMPPKRSGFYFLICMPILIIMYKLALLLQFYDLFFDSFPPTPSLSRLFGN